MIHRELPKQDDECKADLIATIYCSSNQQGCLMEVKQVLKIQEAGSAKPVRPLVLPLCPCMLTIHQMEFLTSCHSRVCAFAFCMMKFALKLAVY